MGFGGNIYKIYSAVFSRLRTLHSVKLLLSYILLCLIFDPLFLQNLFALPTSVNIDRIETPVKGSPSYEIAYKAPDINIPRTINAGTAPIVGLRIKNPTNIDEGSRYITFGHVFKKGDIPRGNDLYIYTRDGEPIEYQLDRKATHTDRSLRHGIITIKSPALNRGEYLDLIIHRGPSHAPLPALSPQNILAQIDNLALRFRVAATNKVVTVNVANEIQKSIDNGSLRTWLQGPIATEIIIHGRVTQHLTYELNLRFYRDGDYRADVIVRREKTYTPGNSGYENYNFSFLQNGQAVFSMDNVAHHHHTNWHKEIWKVSAPVVVPIFDSKYLVNTGATPKYDLSMGVKESAIMDFVEDYNKPEFDTPIHTGNLELSMPAPGGRPDIGPLTQQAATYLVSQDPRMKRILKIMCDASGNIPWHLRDEAYDIDGDGMAEYIRIDNRPNAWASYQVMYEPWSWNQDTIHGYGFGPGPWIIDISHQPSLCYIVYLLSGDLYSLNELHAQTTWNLAHLPPSFRDSDKGIVFINDLEPRFVAWYLRTLGNAAFITPDRHPLKKYFKDRLSFNLEYGYEKYVYHNMPDDFTFGTPQEGYLRFNLPGVEHGWTMVWHNSYFQQVLSMLSYRGEDRAVGFLSWGTKFLTNIVLDRTLRWQGVSAYKLRVNTGTNTENGFTFDYFDTLEEIATVSANYGDIDLSINYLTGGWFAGGYEAFARSVLSSMASLLLTDPRTFENGVTALEALTFVAGNSSEMVRNTDHSYDVNPTNITTLTINGTDIFVADHFSGDSNDNNLNNPANNRNQFIYGGAGNDSVRGGEGNDVLAGGDGDDIIYGNSGNNFLFGNDGDDVLISGSGNDILVGSTGSDRFIFQDQFGVGIVWDFRRGEDLLSVPEEDIENVVVTDDGLRLYFTDRREVFLRNIFSISSLDLVTR